MALTSWFDEEAWPATDDAEGLVLGSLPWAWRLAGALLADLISVLLDSLRCGQVTRSGLAWARLIRHASIFQPVTVVPLTIPVVITALRAPLVLAVGFPALLGARLLPAAFAAVALAAEAGAADAEDYPAPEARSSKERDKLSVRHRSRKPGVDSGPRLWKAQTVTA